MSLLPQSSWLCPYSAECSEKEENQSQYLYNFPYEILMAMHFIRIHEVTHAMENLLWCNLLQLENSWETSRNSNNGQWK